MDALIIIRSTIHKKKGQPLPTRKTHTARAHCHKMDMLQRRSFNRNSRKGSFVVMQAPQQQKQKSVTSCSFVDQSYEPDNDFWFYGNRSNDSESKTKASSTSTSAKNTTSTSKINKRSAAPSKQLQPLPFLRRPHHDHQTERLNSHYDLDKKKKKNQMNFADDEDEEDLTDLSTEHFDTDDIYSSDSSGKDSNQRQQHRYMSPLIRRVAANFENGNANCSSTVTSASQRKVMVLANKENTNARDAMVKNDHLIRKEAMVIMAKKEDDPSGEKSDSVKSFKMKTKGSSETLDVVNKSSVERIKAQDEMMEYNKYCAHFLQNRDKARSARHLRVDICLTEADVDLLPWVHKCSIVNASRWRSTDSGDLLEVMSH